MTSVRRGEAPILARYEGAYAATTLTVMGDRTGFAWEQPPDNADRRTGRRQVEADEDQPSDLCTDAEFLRRVYLDLTGLPPTADEVRAFLADRRETRVKRDELIDRLIGSQEYVEYWTNKWADLLQVNRKFLGVEGAVAFRKWIREQVGEEHAVRPVRPQDPDGERLEPRESAGVLLQDPPRPGGTMENTTQLFLAVRFNCNKCHDHPFERWTQDQYYQTAAFFARVGLKADPARRARRSAAPTSRAPSRCTRTCGTSPTGEVKHDRTGKVTPPKFPYPTPACAADERDAAATAGGLDHVDGQPLLRKSYVNRLWGYLFGVGIIEPIDDIRAGNPPTNPELLDYLTEEFLKSGFDARHVMKLICKSRAYQLSIATNEWNEDDKINYSHAIARRLPAEVLYDAVKRVTGAMSKFPGVPAGHPRRRIAGRGGRAAQRLPHHLRPARPARAPASASAPAACSSARSWRSSTARRSATRSPTRTTSWPKRGRPEDRRQPAWSTNCSSGSSIGRPREGDRGVPEWNAIDGDHAKLAKALGKSRGRSGPDAAAAGKGAAGRPRGGGGGPGLLRAGCSAKIAEAWR